MRRGRIFFYLAFILLLGLAAVAVVWVKFLGGGGLFAKSTPVPADQAPTQVANVINVVVLTQRVPRGSPITETVVKEVAWPEDQALETMVRDVNGAIGRLAKFDLDSGVPLTQGMLVNTTEQLSSKGSIAALSIPRGMVAVSVPISPLTSVSYAPQAGDHVNVIVSVKFADLDSDFQTIMPNTTGNVLAPGPTAEGGPTALTAAVSSGGGPAGRAEIDPVLGQTLYLIPSEAQRPRMASQTLLQDAVVLGVGDFAIEDEEAAAAKATEESIAAEEGEAPPEATPEPSMPDKVTLIVSPQDAVTLNYLLYVLPDSPPVISLALRAAGDDTRVQTEAVTLQFLLDQYRIPVPVKLPYGIQNGGVILTPTETPVP